ncbi:MAG: hypothetical protein ACKVS8_03510 [Phycisphaerales bacterium]
MPIRVYLCSWFRVAGILSLGHAAGVASAQVMDSTAPVVDRYMYVFGSESGTRATVPIFASITADSAPSPGLPPPTDSRFDDRDAQYLLTFDTSAVFTPGQPASSYNVVSVKLTVQIADDSDLAFVYDPTFDSWRSHLFQGDGMSPPDANAIIKDAGAPLELFAVAYRNGFTPFTFGNASPFKPGGQAPPWINNRNAYPVGYSDAGVQVDASNTLKTQTDVLPLGVGSAPALGAGQLVPAGTHFTFEVDLSRAGNLAYVQQALAAGRVPLLVATLTPASEMGAGGVTYPIINTSRAEGTGIVGPRLEIVVQSCSLDYNVDTVVNPDDLGDYITDYFTDPAIPGPGGYAAACPENAPPYDQGYKAAFVPGGTQCNEPFPDNLGDFITAYFNGSC